MEVVNTVQLENELSIVQTVESSNGTYIRGNIGDIIVYKYLPRKTEFI